jgi:hypothetical protein
LVHFGLDLLLGTDRWGFLAAIARPRKVPGVRQVFDQVEALFSKLANDEFKQAEELFAAVVEADA